jgi:hypothetical protein
MDKSKDKISGNPKKLCTLKRKPASGWIINKYNISPILAEIGLFLIK